MIKKHIWISAGEDDKTPLDMCPCIFSLLNINEGDTVICL